MQERFAPASSRDPATAPPTGGRGDLFYRLFLALPEIVWLLDLEGRLLEANRRSEEELGHRTADLRGVRLAENPALTPAAAERLAAELSRIRNGGGPGHFALELALRRPRGEEALYAVKGAVLEDGGGSPAAVWVLSRPIARQATAAGGENATVRALLDAIEALAFLIDRRGLVLEANRLALARMQRPREEVIGRPLISFLPPEVGESRRAKGLEVLASGRPLRFEDTWGEKTFSTSIQPVRDAAGEIVQLAVVSRDVTEERQAEAERRRLALQLQQAQKMEAIGTLAGGIAHDFNNLLMAIQGNISLALFDLEPSHPQYALLTNIERLVQSGADLTSKILGYARKGRYQARPVRLNELLRETAETFGRMRKEIQIVQELSSDLPPVIADRGQLQQVLLNLFVNAGDAMAGKGTLTLATRRVAAEEIPFRAYTVKAGTYVELTVRDTGAGMTPEVRKRIFEPFFTTKKMGRGTGLGLASAYGIVKSHGGYIDVVSAPGEGATFYVYLPAAAAPADGGVREKSPWAPGRGTLLLVDDEAEVLEVTACMLERIGYEVLRAKNGRQAVEIFREQRGRIRLVLLDMVMPEMGGAEVFEALKRIDPGVKVMLATGYSLQGEAGELLSRGCAGFIQKPFDLEELSRRLAAALPPD
ncbi:MAG: ATP-binding protein [Desulfobacterales bacterium]